MGKTTMPAMNATAKSANATIVLSLPRLFPLPMYEAKVISAPIPRLSEK